MTKRGLIKISVHKTKRKKKTELQQVQHDSVWELAPITKIPTPPPLFWVRFKISLITLLPFILIMKLFIRDT